jgi:hypothetical protein
MREPQDWPSSFKEQDLSNLGLHQSMSQSPMFQCSFTVKIELIILFFSNMEVYKAIQGNTEKENNYN